MILNHFPARDLPEKKKLMFSNSQSQNHQLGRSTDSNFMHRFVHFGLGKATCQNQGAAKFDIKCQRTETPNFPFFCTLTCGMQSLIAHKSTEQRTTLFLSNASVMGCTCSYAHVRCAGWNVKNIRHVFLVCTWNAHHTPEWVTRSIRENSLSSVRALKILPA